MYNTIGQHKIIVSYTFCKLSIYTVNISDSMVFQGYLITYTMKTSVTSYFSNKTQVKLIRTLLLVVVN